MLSYPQDAFSHIPIAAERFASSASLQYYEYATSAQSPFAVVKSLVDYLLEKICPKEGNLLCKDHARALDAAEYIDIDYDTISQSLSLSAFFQLKAISQTWDERIEQPKRQAKTEVGVLANEKALRFQELSLGGYLITLGEDSKASMSFTPFYIITAEKN